MKSILKKTFSRETKFFGQSHKFVFYVNKKFWLVFFFYKSLFSILLIKKIDNPKLEISRNISPSICNNYKKRKKNSCQEKYLFFFCSKGDNEVERKEKKTAIVPTREEDYPEWYQQVIKVSDLAENSDVRGCMVIKPYGYALWENIQKHLDLKFKETGHKNAYFPLLVPKSFFEKEAEHVSGFAKECAVVTHSRLEDDGKGGLTVGGELTEPLIVRPTSETIIGASFARWVQSYRDLPLLINQWANIVRWEMRTRMFLRTTEFLWQEGHTVHSTKEEAMEETLKMLGVYATFVREYLAIPVIEGEKTPGERFPGALNTYCIEAMMQDKKALQAGTSHFLGQNFSRAAGIKFQNKNGLEEFGWTTSWGVSTRLIGALIMAHSDDNGLIVPPRVAPIHIVFIPIFKSETDRIVVLNYIKQITIALKKIRYHEESLRVEVDERDLTSSEKNWYWIKKGVPIKVEIGMKDIEKDSLFIACRNKQPFEKESISQNFFLANISDILEGIQRSLYEKAFQLQKENSFKIDLQDDFYRFFQVPKQRKNEIPGGFAFSHWCGSELCEQKVKEELKVTIRCIPLEAEKEKGSCLFCGGNSEKRVIFAKAY